MFHDPHADGVAIVSDFEHVIAKGSGQPPVIGVGQIPPVVFGVAPALVIVEEPAVQATGAARVLPFPYRRSTVAARTPCPNGPSADWMSCCTLARR
ncbi:MAG TPA: hypothetical protein VLI72_17830 [Methylibium sp.]|nr:hypothetical protein [Methylibium sp.]